MLLARRGLEQTRSETACGSADTTRLSPTERSSAQTLALAVFRESARCRGAARLVGARRIICRTVEDDLGLPSIGSAPKIARATSLRPEPTRPAHADDLACAHLEVDVGDARWSPSSPSTSSSTFAGLVPRNCADSSCRRCGRPSCAPVGLASRPPGRTSPMRRPSRSTVMRSPRRRPRPYGVRYR